MWHLLPVLLIWLTAFPVQAVSSRSPYLWNNHHYHLTLGNKLPHGNCYDRAHTGEKKKKTNLKDSRKRKEKKANQISHFFLTSSESLLTNLHTTLHCWSAVHLKLFIRSAEGIKLKEKLPLASQQRSFHESKNSKQENYVLMKLYNRLQKAACPPLNLVDFTNHTFLQGA